MARSSCPQLVMASVAELVNVHAEGRVPVDLSLGLKLAQIAKWSAHSLFYVATT
jgi:hypothetical protein